MSPDTTRDDILRAFAADVVSFASLQTEESLARMVGFFHLAGHALAKIVLDVQPSGLVALHVEVQTEAR